MVCGILVRWLCVANFQADSLVLEVRMGFRSCHRHYDGSIFLVHSHHHRMEVSCLLQRLESELIVKDEVPQRRKRSRQ